jgi:hypothetical protein
MSAPEIKKWMALLIFAGMLMSIGGSYALTQAGISQTKTDLVELGIAEAEARSVLQQGIDHNVEEINELQDCQNAIESDLSTIKADIRWICTTMSSVYDSAN